MIFVQPISESQNLLLKGRVAVGHKNNLAGEGVQGTKPLLLVAQEGESGLLKNHTADPCRSAWFRFDSMDFPGCYRRHSSCVFEM